MMDCKKMCEELLTLLKEDGADEAIEMLEKHIEGYEEDKDEDEDEYDDMDEKDMKKDMKKKGIIITVE